MALTGVYDTSKPKLVSSSSSHTIDVQTNYCIIEDFQVVNTYTGTSNASSIDWETGSYLRVERCILRQISKTTGGDPFYTYNNTATGKKLVFVNNIIYYSTSGEGLYLRGRASDDYILYNNTVVSTASTTNIGLAYFTDTGNILRLRNNITIGSTDGWSNLGAPATDESSHNVYNGTNAPYGTSNIQGTPTFVDSANYNYHLADGDTVAKDAGVDLTANAAHAVTVDNEGDSRAAPLDIGADEIAVSTVTLTVQEAAHGHTVDAVTLGVGLITAEATHAHAVDAVVLGVGLIPAETTHGHTVDSPTFTDFGLAVSDGQHAHTVDNLGLGMKLAPSEATHALRGEATTVSPVIGAAETRHTVTTRNITFTDFGLAVQEATHANLLDSPAVVGHNSVAPAETTVGHTADAPRLVVKLMVQDGQHGHTVDSPTFTDFGLSVQESSHALTSDQVKINSLSVQDADHVHSVDGGLALVAAHVLQLFPYPRHEHTVDELAVSPGYVLAVQDSAHSHSLDAPTITSTYSLAVAGSTHAHTVDGDLTISMFFGLSVPKARHVHRVDNLLVFTKDVQIPLERLLIVQAQSRMMVVEAENRVMRIEAEDRYMTVKGESRSMTVR